MTVLLYSSCCRQQSQVSHRLARPAEDQTFLSDVCSRTASRLPLPHTWQHRAFKGAFLELGLCRVKLTHTHLPLQLYWTELWRVTIAGLGLALAWLLLRPQGVPTMKLPVQRG